MPPAHDHAGVALLRNADFTRYLAARFLGSLAVQMQTVAVGWQVYAVTRDPLDLGLIGLSQFLPFVLLILPAGHIADRCDRRRILVGCYALMFVCAALLLAVHLARAHERVAGVRGDDAVRRRARVRDAGEPGDAAEPGRPRENFGTAVALNSSMWQVATIVGPALGGMLYLAGATTVYCDGRRRCSPSLSC